MAERGHRTKERAPFCETKAYLSSHRNFTPQIDNLTLSRDLLVEIKAQPTTLATRSLILERAVRQGLPFLEVNFRTQKLLSYFLWLNPRSAQEILDPWQPYCISHLSTVQYLASHRVASPMWRTSKLQVTVSQENTSSSWINPA